MLKSKLNFSWLKKNKIRLIIVILSIVLLAAIGLAAKYMYDRYKEESKMLAKYTLYYEGDKENVKKTDEQKKSFSIGVSSIPSDEEPYSHDTESGRALVKLTYQPLIEIGTDMKITYKIADDIEFSDDGMSATISLNDVKFSDGKAVTADDIKNSYKALCSPESQYYDKNKLNVIDGMAAYTIGSSDDISGIECVDNSTIKFSFNERSAFNIMSLTLPIVKSDDDNIYALGTGPYKVSKIVLMNSIELDSNDYCDENPYEYSSITLKTIPSSSIEKEISEFNLDMFYTNSGDVLDTIKDSNYHNVYKTRAEDFYYLGFNLASEKASDINLRKAVACSFDRKVLVDSFYGFEDKTFPLGITSVDKAKKNFSTEIEIDADDAKDFLDDAPSGYGELTYICRNDVNSFNFYEDVKSCLEAADINLEAEKLDEGDYNSRMSEVASGVAEGDLYISKLNGLSPVELLEETVANNAELKKEYDDMILKAYEKDPEDLFECIEEFGYDKVIFIPIVTSYNYIAVSADCNNELMMELFY